MTETERMLIAHFMRDHGEELSKTAIEEIEAAITAMNAEKRPTARDHLLRAERILNRCAGQLEAIRYIIEFPEDIDFLKRAGIIPKEVENEKN